MEQKSLDQIYLTFYTLLYHKKVLLEKDQLGIFLWKNKDSQLKHMKLDEMQMLLQCFHDKQPLLFSFVEEVSDFRLMEEIFQEKVAFRDIPKECGIEEQDGLLKLSVKERIQFLNWYLKQHHKFFRNSQNVKLYQQLAGYVLERDYLLGLIPLFSIDERNELSLKYQNHFYQKQQESFCLMNSLALGSEKSLAQADQILKGWHISKRYRDGVLNRPKEKVINLQGNISFLAKQEKGIDNSLRKEKLKRIHELWDGKKILKYLEEDELNELKALFGYCFGIDFGLSLFHNVVSQNHELLEEKKKEILRASLDVREEEIYQNIVGLSLDSSCMIPYYYEIIKKSQAEMDDLLSEAVFEKDLENYEVYRTMIYDEFLKMQAAYHSLYINGMPVRKKD